MMITRPKNERPSRALECQAAGYPVEWNGRVPAQGRIIKRVRGLRFNHEVQPLLVLRPGDEVELWVNMNGAASAWVADREQKVEGVFLLGLKPNEFEITGWYAELLLCEINKCTSGLRSLSHHHWHCPECNTHLTSLYLCDNCNRRWYPFSTQTWCGEIHALDEGPCLDCDYAERCAEWYEIAFNHHI